uniref:Elongation of very long chain fatty acids protein n=1 Tax=Aceria tosichella TaxID=561515 RepID=A0A6G1S954_9ACAR
MNTRGEPVFDENVYKYYASNRWKFLEEINGVESAGFMIRSPVAVVSCTLAYLGFVCLIGPWMMHNRKPYELKNIIRLYNLAMVIVSAILLKRVYGAVESLGTLVDCNKTFTMADQSGTKVYQMANFILMVRISEYFDTIFFTLRKKPNQVTFLHVFHHTFVPLYAYWILRTAPLRFNVYIILINSFIHVLMYSYYFLATFQQARGESLQPTNEKPSGLMMIVNKLLMFKKYMTQLQIMQFVSLGLYTIWAASQPNMCNVPKTYIVANFLLAFGFLSLFLHFYLNVYKSAGKTTTTTLRTTAASGTRVKDRSD